MVKKKSKKSKGTPMGSGMKFLTRVGGPIAYGFVRQTVSEKLAETEFVKKLPITNFTDEGVMLGLNFLLKKLGVSKNPIGRSILNAQEKIELARLGQTFKDMQDTKSVIGTSSIAQPGLLF